MGLLWITIIVFAIIVFLQKRILTDRIERLERLILHLEERLSQFKENWIPKDRQEETVDETSVKAPDIISIDESYFDPTKPVEGQAQAYPASEGPSMGEDEIPGMSSDEASLEDIVLPGPAEAAYVTESSDPPDFGIKPQTSPTIQTPSVWAEKWQSFKTTVDWEQFTGVKLFAWLGGLALFIAAGFFVKFSIDRNLIPPALRLAISALTGMGIIIGAKFFKNEKYTVMRHTLTAGGIGVLYSVVFAATLYYEYLPRTMGFALLALVSALAFVLAVYYQGMAISVLGAIGAYITPILVSTGQGSLMMLLGYLAVVNMGMYQVVRRLESQMLLLVANSGTLITLTLASGAMFYKTPPMTMALAWGINLSLFTAFLWLRDLNPQKNQSTLWIGMTAYMACLMMATALLLRSGAAPLLLVIIAQAAVMVLAWQNKGWYNKIIPYGALGFCAVLLWSLYRFSASQFSMDFFLLLIYGIIGGLGPIVLVFRYGSIPNMVLWFRVFPVAVVILGAWIIFKEPRVSFWFWPLIMGLELLSITISILIRGFIQVVLLVLVFLWTALQWVFNSPELMLGPGFFVFIIFSGMILCTVVFLLLKNLANLQTILNLGTQPPADEDHPPKMTGMEQWIAAAPAAGVFILLAASFMVKYPFYPHPGMATLVCFLLLVLFVIHRLKLELPGVCTLMAAALAQAVFVFHPVLGFPAIFATLVWSGALFLIAIPIPFMAFKSYDQWKKIWNAWAVFEALQAIFILYASQRYWEASIAHWMPLLLAGVKLPAVAVLLKRFKGNTQRNAILAFHGGALLFYFSTLPVLVLDHGWIGISFVFEAAALLWLNRRIEHPGLRWVSLVMAPLGVLLLVFNLPLLKGADSLPVLNPAVLSVAAAIIALGFAVSQAGYPRRQLKNLDLPNYFLWLTVGTGFFFINLVISDIFALPGHRFTVWPGKSFLQSACYALSWVGLGGLLWRSINLPRILRFVALGLICAGAVWLIGLPFMLPRAIGQMTPFLNLIPVVYIPLIAFLYFLFHKERWDEQYSIIKNLMLAFFLVLGFMTVKMESSTLFQTGYPFSLHFSHTPFQGAISAVGWLVYGLGLLIWPKRLDRPFRISGLILIYIGLFKALMVPFQFRAEFAQMTSFINMPTLVYGLFLGILTWLTVKTWDHRWPVPFVRPRVLMGITLAVFTFSVLNIEIASVFAIKGRPFSMLTHGSLSMQLAYSIGWLLFASGLLLVGIKWDEVNVRWAAIIAIVATAVKIFIRDLWSLGQLYRVGSLVGLAIVMILVSLLYQWFLSKGKQDEK